MIKKLFGNSLFKDTGIYTLSSIINSAIPFLMLPILTRYLMPEDYGIVSMFSLLVTLVVPFIGLSVNGAIARQYYNPEEIDIWAYVGNCILILLVSTTVVGAVFFLLAKPISIITSFPTKMLWTIIIFSLAQVINSIVLSLLQVQKKVLLYGIFNISKTFVNMILSVFLVVYMGLGWQGRIYGQLLSVVLFVGIAVVILIKNKWISLSFNKKYILNALLFGAPLIPHALAGSIISMTDRLFISNMVGLAATGVYTVGYQVGSVIEMLAVSFNNAYVPWLYEKLKKNNYNTKIKIVKFTYLYFIIIILIAIGLGSIAPYGLEAFLGKSFEGSSAYVIWIAMGYAFSGMYYMVVNYIFYEGKNKYLAWVTFIVAMINIILNYIFIKMFGALGAAQATTVTFGIQFIMVWILSARTHKMPWKDVLIDSFKRKRFK